jgi:hypothetical protein
MNLPNYFLADLPSEATLSAAMITEACQTLKRNREHYLAGRPTHRLVRLLSEIGESWLQPDYPFRKLALDRGTAATGFSRPTLADGTRLIFFPAHRREPSRAARPGAWPCEPSR